MIHVNCPDCGRSYLLSPKTQGKQATCKECGSRFAIPVQRMKAGLQAGLGAKRRPADTSSRVKQLLELLDRMEEFPHPRASLGYRVHLVFVAGMMLLLPLLYFAFVAGVAWLTWWHATHNHVWMSAVYGVRAAIFLGILYVGLIIAGSVWVLSLIKPIFVRIRQQPGSGGLSREDEPALFAFAAVAPESPIHHCPPRH